METLNNIWNLIKPYLPLIIQAIIIPILLPIIKKIVSGVVGAKVDDAMNEKKLEKSYQRIFDDVIGQIKNISFTQSIQPVLNSTLDGIQEKAIAQLKGELDLNKEIDKKMLIMFKDFMDMFKASVMNNPEIQAKLDEDFDNAIALIESNQDKVIETEVVIEEPKAEKKAPKEPTNNVTMEI